RAAMRLASAPPAWPPMPSATTSRCPRRPLDCTRGSGRLVWSTRSILASSATTNWSSLLGRTRPVSVRPQHSTCRAEPSGSNSQVSAGRSWPAVFSTFLSALIAVTPAVRGAASVTAGRRGANRVPALAAGRPRVYNHGRPDPRRAGRTTAPRFAITPPLDDLGAITRDLRFYPSPVKQPQTLTKEQVEAFNRDGYLKG